MRQRDKIDYTSVNAEAVADTARARELNRDGTIALKAGNLEKSERLFRDALLADVNYGPAHNNLGQLHFQRHEFYQAAWEFELATNTMPGRIEPLINLGLVYEYADRLDRAEEYYRQAHTLDPRSAVALGNLARVLVRQEGEVSEINHLLHELLLHDSRGEWVHWAEELLATRYRDDLCHGLNAGLSDTPANFPGPESSGGAPALLETLPLPKPQPLPQVPELLPPPSPPPTPAAAESLIQPALPLKLSQQSPKKPGQARYLPAPATAAQPTSAASEIMRVQWQDLLSADEAKQ